MQSSKNISLLIALALTGCSAINSSNPTPLPTVVLDSGAVSATRAPQTANVSAGVVASGFVVTSAQAQLAAPQSERVSGIKVALGDKVVPNQPLIVLDASSAQAQFAQAKAALALAQANHDTLANSANNPQLRQAEAGVIVATVNYSRTLGSARPSDIAAAQSAYNAASAAYQKLKVGPDAADVALAQANYLSAEAALKKAQASYDIAYAANPAGISGSPVSLALEQATNAYNAAKAIYEKSSKPADAAQLAASQQILDAARASLDRAVKPGSDLDIAQAKAQLDAAMAQRDAMTPSADQLAASKAQVTLALAQVQSAESALNRATIQSPISGTVAKIFVNVGEWVTAGQPLIAVSDVDHLQVETKDLSERDVARVSVGQKVSVLIKPLNQQVSGRVKSVAPTADTLGGDVVYKTVVELDSQPAGVRAGMSVDVRFG